MFTTAKAGAGMNVAEMDKSQEGRGRELKRPSQQQRLLKSADGGEK